MEDIKKISNYLAERYNFMVDEIKKDKDQYNLASHHGEKFACIKTMNFIYKEFGVAPDIELKN